MDNDNVNPMMRDFRQQQQQRSPRYHHHSDFDCYDDNIVDDDDDDTRQRPSPPRSASFVKSLMSGEVIHHVKKGNQNIAVGTLSLFLCVFLGGDENIIILVIFQHTKI